MVHFVGYYAEDERVSKVCFYWHMILVCGILTGVDPHQKQYGFELFYSEIIDPFFLCLHDVQNVKKKIINNDFILQNVEKQIL